MPKWEYFRNRKEWVCESKEYGIVRIPVEYFHGLLCWKKCPHWQECKYGCTFGFVYKKRYAIIRILAKDQFQTKAGWKKGRKRKGVRGKAVDFVQTKGEKKK